MYEIQKASTVKRISALLLDLILLATVAVGIGSLLSAITKYDSYSDRLQEIYREYETKYGVDFNITPEDYAALSDSEKARYNEANTALVENTEAKDVYNTIINLIIFNVSIALFVSFMLMEFLIPMLLGNGMTVGKKIFGIAVIRTDGVKINRLQLFARSILGKYTFETMVPVLIVIMLYFGTLGFLGLLILLAIIVIQTVLIISTDKNQAIHDVLAYTCLADYSSTKIFDTEALRDEYLKKLEAEAAERENDTYRY